MNGEQELCRRCRGRILSGGMMIDGSAVCDSCAEIILAEKERGYSRGSGAGVLSGRRCARCGADLISLPPEQIKSVDGKEYCDICLGRVKEQRLKALSVLEDMYAYLSARALNVSCSEHENGYLLEISEADGRDTIEIYLDEEASVFFADWHKHYSFEPCPSAWSLNDLYADLNDLLEGRVCAVCAYTIGASEPKLCAGSLERADELTEEYLRSEFGSGKFVRCNFWDSSLNLEFKLADPYGESEKKTVRAGLAAVKAVLLGADTEAKRRLLFCLDWFLAPCYGQDISDIKQPLMELLQTMAIMPNEESIIEIALMLLGTYGAPPYKILESHFEIIPEKHKPYVLHLLEIS